MTTCEPENESQRKRNHKFRAYIISLTEKRDKWNTTFSFRVGCLKLIERNTSLPLTQVYTVSLNHLSTLFFLDFPSLKTHLLMSDGLCLLDESNQQKILTANLKGSCFTDKPPTVFKNATSLEKLETPCINMSLFCSFKKPYLSISDGLCLLEESNRQQQACVLTQYKMIIVMKRIVKTIPTVTPTNINI